MSKGQITIPKTIRTLLKADKDDIIQFVVESERIYIQKVSNLCPVCSGKKVLQEYTCFFCLEIGELPEAFNPFQYQPFWLNQYGVESTLNLVSLNGMVTPKIVLTSDNYSEEVLAVAHDAYLLLLTQSDLFNGEILQPEFKTEHIQKYWTRYVGKDNE